MSPVSVSASECVCACVRAGEGIVLQNKTLGQDWLSPTGLGNQFGVADVHWSLLSVSGPWRREPTASAPCPVRLLLVVDELKEEFY